MPITNFYRRGGKENGHRSRCKTCLGLVTRDWKRKNPERTKCYYQKWYEANGDKYFSQWRQDNRLNIRKQHARYKKSNPEIFSHHENKRRLAKLGNGGSHTLTEWEHIKKIGNYQCAKCGKKEPDIILTRDHIIPVSKGGSDNKENIQPLCRSCNASKYNKLLDESEAHNAKHY